jgi:hypothetical protein
LSPSDQKNWDTLSDQAKDLIIKAHIPLTCPRQINQTETHVPSDSDDQDNPDDNTAPSGDDPNLSVNTSQREKSSDSSKVPPAGQKIPSLSPPLTQLLGKLQPTKGTQMRQHNVHRMTYHSKGTYSISSTHTSSSYGALVDRGANEGLAGNDMRVIAVDPHQKVSISGLDNHQVTDLDIEMAGTHLQSQRGPVIGIFHQYARMPMGRIIHSSNQLEHHKLDVDERPMKVGGSQCITTPNGYAFPVDVIDGLAYLKCCTYTDEEFQSLPHVIMTSNVVWEPSILDCTISSDDKWHNSVLDLGRSYSSPCDEFGRYKQRQGPPIPVTPSRYQQRPMMLVTAFLQNQTS